MKRKRIAISLLCIILVFAMAGCSNASMDTTPTPSIDTEQEASAASNDSSNQISEADAEEMNDEKINDEEMDSDKIILTVGSHTLTATLVDNSSAAVLREHLEEEILTVNLSDYGGFEKVGAIGIDLPSNNQQTTTSAGDFVPYAGNSLVIFYGSNSWSYTRLGKIDDVTATELRRLLRTGDVTDTLSLPQ